MADLTVTAASVRPVGQCIVRRFTAGATLTPGQAVYISANDTVSPAQGTTIAKAQVIGLVVSNGEGAVSFSANDVVDVVLRGEVTGFATNVTANGTAYIGDVAGIMTVAVGTDPCRVGIGRNATTLYVNPMLLHSA
jgi:hypothetical protein